MRVALVVFAMFVSPWPAVAAAEEGWHRVTEKDGIVIERRPVAGSRIFETRATTSSTLTPAQIFTVLEDRRGYEEFMPYIKKQQIIRETPGEVVVYDQVRVPLVSDRDYTVRARHWVEPETQIHRVDFRSADEEGPPPQKGHVRVRSIRGSWELRPSTTGGTDVVYLLHSDPGGYIPTWIINVVQKKEVPKFLKIMLDRAAMKAGK